MTDARPVLGNDLLTIIALLIETYGDNGTAAIPPRVQFELDHRAQVVFWPMLDGTIQISVIGRDGLRAGQAEPGVVYQNSGGALHLDGATIEARGEAT